jgi:WD40 repeat protein
VIVSGSDDRTVRMRDAASGALMHTLEGHEDWVRSVALGELSGQSVIVSGSSDRTVRVWDAASGALMHTLEGHEDWVWSVALAWISMDVSRPNIFHLNPVYPII